LGRESRRQNPLTGGKGTPSKVARGENFQDPLSLTKNCTLGAKLLTPRKRSVCDNRGRGKHRKVEKLLWEKNFPSRGRGCFTPKKKGLRGPVEKKTRGGDEIIYNRGGTFFRTSHSPNGKGKGRPNRGGNRSIRKGNTVRRRVNAGEVPSVLNPP